MNGNDSDRYLRFKGYDESLGFSYSSDQHFNDVAATRRIYLEQGELMGVYYQKARKVDQVYADYLYELWVTGKDDTQNLLNVMEALANQQTPPVPPNPSVWNIPQTVMCFKDKKYGTYGGKGISGLYHLEGSPIWQGKAESVFNILGDLFTLENGADIYNSQGSVYHHPSWTLMLYLIEINGVTFANGCAYGTGKSDGGILRSTDKQLWHPHWSNSSGIMLWTPYALGGSLGYAGSGGNTDWGAGSWPLIWQDGQVIFEDKSRQGEGFWASAVHQGRRYFGGSGRARVFCLESGTDFTFDGEVVHWITSYKDILWVGVSGPNGAELWSLSNIGWTKERKFDFPTIMSGSWEPDGLYICGGKFGEWGRIVRI